jgi:hypothetical protein
VNGGRSFQERAETAYYSGVDTTEGRKGWLAEETKIFSSVAEGARFENPLAPETIVHDLASSFQSQSLPRESETVEAPIKTHGTG